MYRIIESKTGRKYLYDSISNNFFEPTDEVLKLLPETGGELSDLKKLGDDFYQTVWGEYKFENLLEFIPQTSPNESPEVLILELTQQCNFRCTYCIYSGVYCYERTHSEKSLPDDLRREVLTYFFHEQPVPPANISFYGGEPLLEYQQIKDTVEYLKTRGFENTGYYITTNGVLLANEHILQFLVENSFQIGISFDGLNHDLYRKSSLGRTTSSDVLAVIDTISVKYPNFFKTNLRLSVTLAPPYRLYENSCFFGEHPLLSRIPLLINSVNSDDTGFFDQFDMEEETRQLTNDYLRLSNEYIDMNKQPPLFHRALFDDHVKRFEYREMRLQSNAFPPGNCAIGSKRLFVTCSGDKYPCERVGTYGFLGNVSDGRKLTDKYENVLHEYKKAVLPNCARCHLVRVCNYCISTFRQGDKMGGWERITRQCEKQREWFDLIMYIYVSKMEKNIP